ncbi:glycosyltransferase family 2 protein [Shimia abyssi]|uniref:Glycosyl transferase family 2 n=1 Tax=Shimia abyssi TaxID=1662395 RepID=A0A2P8FFA9_9RHOB|nr:glycosyltransferase family 2 protein [Shimia abyssi]PSL20399.1 glycosyl transferase family 2 [Shimia abyssi]
MTRWGIASTIKAPARDVLAFVAYHLDLGADHIFIYLDNENKKALSALRDHPQVTVTRTNGDYWRSIGKKKPDAHQPRQTINASHAYALDHGLDWLAHIDVDEYLCPTQPVRDLLSALPTDVVCARVRPAEALSTDGVDGLDPTATYCKRWIGTEHSRIELERTFYPNFGGIRRSGFVSHSVGKIFIRAGLPNLRFRIHRGTQDNVEIGPRQVLEHIELCHMHIKSWDDWQKIFDYRLTKGSYRSSLKSDRKLGLGGMSLHDLFTFLIDDGGEAALRNFFEEVCLARPELIKQLRHHDLLSVFHLDLDTKRRKHFPEFS